MRSKFIRVVAKFIVMIGNLPHDRKK